MTHDGRWLMEIRRVGALRPMAVLAAVALCVAAAAPGASAQAPGGTSDLAPIAWIAGQWIGHQGAPAPGGADVLMDVRWAPNGRALLMDLTSTRDGVAQPFMSAAYYWHPGTRAITMWQILSGGAVNDGRVVAASDAGLTQELSATDPDGSVRLLRTEFVRDAPDQFRFISSSRASTDAPWTPNTPIRFVRKRLP